MGWNELSSRQKDLDRKIENCGIRLDTSSSCLKSVMKAIGASASGPSTSEAVSFCD